MGKITGISWTDHTFNPWWGCTKVSPGCANCYAERDSKRWGMDIWGQAAARRFFGDKHWNEPLAWNRAAERDGVRRRVFCGSMCDVFEDRPDLVEHRLRLWELVESTPALDWLLLTKRPENVERMLPERWSSWGYFELHNDLPAGGPFPRNAWMGVTAENQEQFDARWPMLENIGRRWYVPVLFISAEPLLGPINMADCLEEFTEHEEDNTIWVRGIDWVICGGESGPHARPMHPAWARSIRDQCQEAGVPFFFKQLGEYVSIPQARDLGVQLSMVEAMNVNAIGGGFVRVGKKRAGDLLDGAAWHEFPKP